MQCPKILISLCLLSGKKISIKICKDIPVYQITIHHVQQKAGISLNKVLVVSLFYFTISLKSLHLYYLFRKYM